MTRNRVSALVAGAALVVGSSMVLATPATAADANPYDPTFVPNATDDLVGVGSDTIQTVMHDIATAYNSGRASGRIASFAADGAPADIVLRTGVAPITRPASSGKGKERLYGAGNNAAVSFARSSGTLSAAEITAGLRQAAFAVDGLQVAVSAAGSNAPAELTRAQILKIFTGEVTNWSQVGGRPGVIKPYVPFSGSGTRSFFVAQLKAENGNVDPVLKAAETQEHSPEVLENDPNAIAPFSTARAAVGPAAPKVKLVDGWSAERPVYNVFRGTDLNTAVNPALAAQLSGVFGEDGFICSEAGRTVIEAAGFEQLASTDDGGVCGEFVSDPVSNLKTSDQADAAATTTTLAATAPGGRKVVLKATVASAGGSSASGKVEFYEGATKVGTAFPAGGVATLTLSNVTVGAHGYVAKFVPTDDGDFTASESAEQPVTVKTPTAVSLTTRPGVYGTASSVTVKATADGGAATGAVSVKVGSAAAKSFALTAAGTAVVPVPAGTPAGTLTVSATLPGTASLDAASATAKVSIAKARSKAVAKLTKSAIRAKQRGVLVVKVAAPGTVTGKVVVKAGAKTVGVGTVKKGKAIVKLAKLKKGTYKLAAVYGGSSNVAGAKAKVVKLKVRA